MYSLNRVEIQGGETYAKSTDDSENAGGDRNVPEQDVEGGTVHCDRVHPWYERTRAAS